MSDITVVKFVVDTDSTPGRMVQKLAHTFDTSRALYNWGIQLIDSYRWAARSRVNARALSEAGDQEGALGLHADKAWRKSAYKEADEWLHTHPEDWWYRVDESNTELTELRRAEALHYAEALIEVVDERSPGKFRAPSAYDLARLFTIEKSRVGSRWYGCDINRHVVSDAFTTADRAFQNFLGGVINRGNSKRKDRPSGWPRYRRYSDRQSFAMCTLPVGGRGCVVDEYRVKVPSGIEVAVFGGTSRLSSLYRRDESVRATTARFVTEPGGRIALALTLSAADGVFQTDRTHEMKNDVVGVDWGVARFATLSDGTMIENPRHFEQMQDRIVALQRRMSELRPSTPDGKVAPATRAWKKLAARHAVLSAKTARARDGFINQVTKDLATRYSTIVLEDLAVLQMVARPEAIEAEDGTFEKNGAGVKAGLNRSILHAAPGEFVRQLQYKAERYGSTVVCAPRDFPSTRLCNECGVVNESVSLAQRQHTCDGCGATWDQDINAAINLRNWWLNEKSLLSEG